jgi:flagellar biogenesis protein FliO
MNDETKRKLEEDGVKIIEEPVDWGQLFLVMFLLIMLILIVYFSV